MVPFGKLRVNWLTMSDFGLSKVFSEQKLLSFQNQGIAGLLR
jgi:hypothetical protein